MPSPRNRVARISVSGLLVTLALLGCTILRPPAPTALSAKVPAAIAPSPAAAAPPPTVATPGSEKITLTAETFFAPGEAILGEANQRKLDELVAKIKGVNLEAIVAVGRTGSVGTDAYNRRLSQRRSEAVKAYLASIGLEKNRIYTEGRGALQPLTDNKTTQGRALSNRAIIQITGVRTAPIYAEASASVPDQSGNGISLLFATNRTPAIGTVVRPRDTFTNDRGPLTYGIARVSVPVTRSVGEINRPWKLFGFEFPEDPTLHMVILDVSQVDAKSIAQLSDYFFAGDQGARKAFIFVHGFNVSFADAAMRTAQMATDMNLKSMPVFFSWASKNDWKRYTVDENTAEQSVPDFKQFLRTYMAEAKVDQVILVAHSMGSRIVTRSVVEMVQSDPSLAPKILQLVLAAPDLDATVFREQVMPVLATQKIPMTLYASTRDRALATSVELHGCCRAGSGGKNILVGQGVESIDASTIDTDFLGHSYFAETRPLLTDIDLLVQEGMPAARRPMLSGLPKKAVPPSYWQFKP